MTTRRQGRDFKPLASTPKSILFQLGHHVSQSGASGKVQKRSEECESVRGMGNEQSYLGGGDSSAGRRPARRVRTLEVGLRGGMAIAMTVYGEWEQTSYLERRLKQALLLSVCEAFEMIKLQNNGCLLFLRTPCTLHKIEKKKKKDETDLAVP